MSLYYKAKDLYLKKNKVNISIMSKKKNTPVKITIKERIRSNPSYLIGALCTVFLIALAVFLFAPRLFGKKTDTIGITYSDLQKNYKETTLYNELFIGFNCDLPDIIYVEPTNDGTKRTDLKYFAMPINNTFTNLEVTVQGSVSKYNGEIAGIRFMYEDTSDSNESDDVFLSVLLYYRMVFNSVFPDMTDKEVTDILTAAASDGEYYVRDNIRVKFSKRPANGKTYYVLDFLPVTDTE